MKRIPSAPRTTLSLASLALLASLTACGGGGGGDDGEGDSGAGAAETTAPATVILEGQVTKGPVAGATVVALRVAADGTPGAELARTTSAADGSYRLSVPAEATTVLVQASGGTYDHEYIDGVDSTPLDAPLRSWVTLGAGATGSRSVHLTPLTETAVRRALAASGGATEANLAAAAAAVVRETALAGTDLVSTAAVVTGTTNAYGQAVLRLARLMQQAGSLEAILALYAQGVPGDTAVVATVALPPEMARSALHDTRWRSRCIVSRGITTTSEGTQITYESFSQALGFTGTGTDGEYRETTEYSYYSDAGCSSPLATLDQVAAEDLREARIRFTAQVRLADGSSAYRYSRSTTAASTGAQRTVDGLMYRLEGSGASRVLTRADGYSEGSGVHFGTVRQFDILTPAELPEAYRASRALEKDWYQPCVVGAGSVTVAAANTTHAYGSRRIGWQMGNTVAATPWSYYLNATTAYYSDAGCQTAVVLAGDPDENIVTLESLVTLSDGTQAVRGTALRKAAGTQVQSTAKVLLRLADKALVLDLAVSDAGAEVYPGAASLRRHTIGYQPANRR